MANETNQANQNELRIIGDIEEAPSFDKLYEIIRKKGIITSSKHKYEAPYLINKIDQIRGELGDSQKEDEIKDLSRKAIKRFMAKKNLIIKKLIIDITRSNGLRAKVIELVINEVIERKRG